MPKSLQHSVQSSVSVVRSVFFRHRHNNQVSIAQVLQHCISDLTLTYGSRSVIRTLHDPDACF